MGRFNELMARVASSYTYERAKKFAQSPFANEIRHDLPIEAKKDLIFWPYEINVKASVGSGGWASVPWLAFFDPLVTSGATEGFYPVYLFDADRSVAILSMNQGTTSVINDYKLSAHDVLRSRAEVMRQRVPEHEQAFPLREINLSSTDTLPGSYAAGHAFGAEYSLEDLANVDLSKDLIHMLGLYAKLIERGGTIPIEVMVEASGTNDIIETRRTVLSQRIERSSNVRAKVFGHKSAFVCEGCGLQPVEDYCCFNETKGVPLDVHHCFPIGHLAEGKTRWYKVPDDFLVLCPNCHRVIHTLSDPADLDELRNRVKFKYARQTKGTLF